MFKKFRLFALAFCAMCVVSAARADDFAMAAQLLSAAKNGDIQTVQALVNQGANINYVDNTGLSLVCTALMNNDMKAAQILQVYGADASKCDRQIKQYNQKLPKSDSGGMFSGLSTAQTIALAAGGAAIVAGGAWLLISQLGNAHGNGNGGSGGGTGNRPGGGGDTGGTGGGTTPWTPGGLPKGPAELAANFSYPNELNFFSPSASDTANQGNYLNFNVFNQAGAAINQNYLLMMHGYSPMARGYMGMTTLRDANNAPLPLILPNLYNTYSGQQAMGGKPILTALITANGVNPTGSATGQTFLTWATCASATGNCTGPATIATKYANDTYTDPMNPATISENAATVKSFDFSGYGTVYHSAGADTILAQIIGGGFGGSATGAGDFVGFMPNGQLAIYRTGGGMLWSTANAGATIATDAAGGPSFQTATAVTWGNGDQFSATYNAAAGTLTLVNILTSTSVTWTVSPNGLTAYSAPATDGSRTVYNIDTAGNIVWAGTLSSGGTLTPPPTPTTVGTAAGNSTLRTLSTLTIDNAGVPTTYQTAFDPKTNAMTLTPCTDATCTTIDATGAILNWSIGDNNTAAEVFGTGFKYYTLDPATGTVTLVAAKTQQDYKNWQAMSNAMTTGAASIANAATIPSMTLANTDTVASVAVLLSQYADIPSQRILFNQMIDSYYSPLYNSDPALNNEPAGANPQSYYAGLVLGGTNAANNSPILIFGAGMSQFGAGEKLSTKLATFENYAPALYPNLDKLFMTVVAVQYISGTGTSQVSSIYSYDPATAGKIGLALTTDGTTVLQSRACGVAGLGTGSVDPWCFAAAGANTGQAVAAMAGAVGAVKGAFGGMTTPMTNQQVFTLLALTADGPYLGTDTRGGGSTAFTADTLTAYLKSIYALPADRQVIVDSGKVSYLQEFAQVFGYGLVNLERAVTPGTKVYFYTANKISSGSGNAYWRVASVSAQAAANTTLALSPSFGARNATIGVPVYDVLTSLDGTVSMPRIFANTISLDTRQSGLLSANMLAAFSVDGHDDSQFTIHDSRMTFNLSMRDSFVNDGYGNLDKVGMNYASGNWSFGAKYEHDFGDTNIVRGDAANPVLALASNTISSDATYHSGNWSFNARGFSGSMTAEGLLANDPAMTGMYVPARLGGVAGASAGAGYAFGKHVKFESSVGFMNESDTILGAYSGGMLGLGGADTTYIDNVLSVDITRDLKFNARYTYAQTRGNPVGGMVLGLSDLESDAYSVGLQYGGWSFNAALPLAVTHGGMQYATADYSLADSPTGAGYDLVANPYAANLDLSAHAREARFSAAYRTKLDDRTSAAIGFIYRINPNNTAAFGNESILMLKLNHLIGI